MPDNSNSFFAEVARTAEDAGFAEGDRVSEDFSVVGFDDIPRAAAVFPALTTIAQPIGEMGRIRVRLLLGRIARGHPKGDKPYQRVRLPTRLVIRESMGPPGESVSR